MKSRGKEPHSNLSEDLSAAQRCKDDRMNGAVMKWREGKQKVACCCPCSHVETVIWALTSSEILKNVTPLRSLKTSSQHTLCWPYVFDVQFRPHLLLALLLNSIFCPSWQLLKNASLSSARPQEEEDPFHTHRLVTSASDHMARASSPHAIYHLVSKELPFRGDKGTHTEEERKSKKFPFQERRHIPFIWCTAFTLFLLPLLRKDPYLVTVSNLTQLFLSSNISQH